ncbi:hypothetical protein JTE90_018419 [Oedothorax gibbosus]|uniref:DUF5641 domain-containing protein n=1 Tax=Oedothorax gibbosus TaxID=931172 RepID=A0AAV6TZE0_9ARAC|nr:hypothetical protein JTE90_018419 [Oedothorax gibbosus]
MTRMVAWIKRFIYNCKKTNHVKLTGEPTALEIHAAEKNLLKLVQRESFTSKEDKRLAALDVYEDEQGLLRLKTKVVFKRDTEDFRCPVILPSDHVVVKRLIRGEHQNVKEIGTPYFDVVDNTRLNKRLKHRQKLIADLRARFRSEYLGLLIQRPQHKKWKSQISIGDIVLIGCDNVKRMDWPLGSDRNHPREGQRQ